MRKQTGFTLIEVLVVIGVIALLTAILLPTLQRVKRQARAVACQSNLRQWNTILALYLGDSEGVLPKQKYYSLATPEHWMYALRGHATAAEGIYCCPMATEPAYETTQRTGDVSNIMRQPAPNIPAGGRFTAWGKLSFRIEGRPTPEYYGSYGMNNWLAIPREGASFIIGCARGMREHEKSFWLNANVGGQADVPTFLDAWWWCAWVKDSDAPPQYDGDRSSFPCGCTNSIHRFCTNRHDGYVNAAFLDSSVRKVGLKQLWTLKWYRTFNTANHWTGAGNVQPLDWPEWMRNFRDY